MMRLYERCGRGVKPRGPGASRVRAAATGRRRRRAGRRARARPPGRALAVDDVAHARDPRRAGDGRAHPRRRGPTGSRSGDADTPRRRRRRRCCAQRLRPLAAEMHRAYGENAAVGIDDGSGFLYLASARVPAAVQVADPVGETFPYHLVAPGLVAMAAWPESSGSTEYLAGPVAAATAHASPSRRRSAGDSSAVRDATATRGPTRSSTSRSTAWQHRSSTPRAR